MALILDDWKFIQFDDPERNALYNLKTDPQELHNLLLSRHSDDHPAINWEAELKDWFEGFGKLEISNFQPSREQLERLRSLGYVR
ncbi:hypothetical protein MYX84_10510 [Acidobacteria bacterium AH-259-O06]|nr:hypothetical protein [Acidobacteria bacterium AH-259-O06]